MAGGDGLRPGPGPYKALHLTGTVRASDPLDESLRAYRLSLLSTRLVSSTSVTVPLGEFKAAEPDPLWGRSARTGSAPSELPFPGGPVRSLQEVTDGLRVLLTCRCGTCRHRSREG